MEHWSLIAADEIHMQFPFSYFRCKREGDIEKTEKIITKHNKSDDILRKVKFVFSEDKELMEYIQALEETHP